MINVLHGGLVRWSASVDSSSADFVAGDVLELMSNGNVRAVAGTSTTSVKGLALEAIPSTTATSADSKLGVPSGDRVSMLLDIAVVQTDNITSGITFEPNGTVYPETSTHTITDQSSVNQVLGKALTYTPWTQTATWLFSVQY
jgi:hypothetical protein